MPEAPKQRSTEYFGVGQSGYTAGRLEDDPSLERQLEDRNLSYPKETDVAAIDAGDDERFTGRGGRHWAPEEPEVAKQPKP